jgi:hypothetical protein
MAQPLRKDDGKLYIADILTGSCRGWLVRMSLSMLSQMPTVLLHQVHEQFMRNAKSRINYGTKSMHPPRRGTVFHSWWEE